MKKVYGLLMLLTGFILINADAVAQYCTPNIGSNWGYIKEVKTTGGVINISKTTGSFRGTGAARNYTATDSISTNYGQTFTLTVTRSYATGVWVDWNDDGDFTDAGEQHMLDATYTSLETTFNLNITVPSNAAYGQLRMRILTGYSFRLGPCGYSSYTGESEDYRIWIPKPKKTDAGVTEMTPSTLCSGPQDVKVRVVNFGLDTMNTVTVQGSVGSTSYGPVTLTNLGLPWLGDTVYTLATHTFTAGTNYDIKAWTSAPNAGTDSSAANDTLLIKNFSTALSGDYTVGLNTTDDFSSIQDAVNALQSVGVCGPVRLLLYDAGTYNEKVDVSTILGVSATNTVTITNNPTNSTYAVWESAGTSAKNYLLKFSGTQYFNVDSITMRNTNGSYSRVVEFAGGERYINFTNDSLLARLSTSTTNFRAVVFDNSGNNYSENIKFANNYIYGGSYGFYIYGSNTSNRQSNWELSNNHIVEWYYRGIHAYYINNFEITGNVIKDKSTSNYCCGSSALYSYYNNNTDVVGNIMEAKGTSYSYVCYLYRNYGTSTDRILVANNMVSAPRSGGTSTTYGIYTYYPNYGEYVNNSVYVRGGGSNASAMYFRYGTQARYYNNAVRKDGQGYATRFNGSITRYNNASWAPNGTAWSGGSGTSPLTADPGFVSATDLHATSPQLHDAGDTSYVNKVSDDIDGDVRCPLTNCPGSGSAPDIGADEYWLPDYDIAPLATAEAPCSGTQDVKVTIKNRGVKTLTSFNVDWWIGTTAQTQLSVLVSNIPAGGDTTVVVGTHNFVSGTPYGFKFATSNPSGQTDQITDNDTLDVTIQNSLSGTYTVGTGGDYPGLDSAINELHTLGMCGNVVLNLLDSTFNESVALDAIAGNSSSNTLTIQSHPNNANMATLDGTISLRDMTHVTIKKMHFETTGNAINVPGGLVTNLVIDSNLFDLGQNAGYAFYENTYAKNLDSLWFTNNTVNKGTYALRIYGGSANQAASKESNIYIENNNLMDWYNYGMYVYYARQVSIKNNRVESTGENSLNTTYPRGMMVYYTDRFQIEDNVVNAIGASGGYGMYIYYGNYYATSSDTSRVVNNYVNVGHRNNNFTHYGTYFFRSYRVKMYHNNINVESNYSNAYTHYMYYMNFADMKNNIFGSEANTVYNRFSSSYSADYNAFWVGSSTSDGTRSFTRGSNSMIANPRFKNPSKGDLRVNSLLLDSTAVNVGVSTDIYGNTRVLGSHDIGAHEFTPCYYDAVSKEFYARYTQIPIGQSVRMYGLVGNVGLDTITGVVANGQVGASISTIPIGALATDAESSFSMAVPLTGPTGVVNASLFATLNETDCDNGNDSLKYAFEVSDSVYAYDDSSVTGGLGYNNNIGEFGSVFEIFAADTITSGTFYLSSPPQGATVRLMVYEFDTAGPGNVIDSTRAFQVGANGAGWYTLQFGCNGIAAQPGQYLVCVDQPNPVNMSLGYYAGGDGVADTRWNRLAGGTWEDMYQNPNNAIATSTLLLRVNLGEVSDNDVLAPNTLICNNSSTYIKTNANYATTIWSNGLLFDSIQVTTPGTYSVTVYDQIGCKYEDSTVASMATPMTVNSTPTAASCGMSDGSVALTVAGAYGPHTYSWSNGSSTQNLSNIPGGNYDVTITDSIGCMNTQSVQVLGLYPDVASTWAYPTCNGDNNGSATASVTTGVAPYTYAWDKGGSTGNDVNINLDAGTYVVSVTDASGCMTTDTVVVMDPPVLNVSQQVGAPSACKMADGSAEAKMSGGITPYNFLWSNGQTTGKAVGLTEGIYDVSITDANGCVVVTRMTVEDPNSPVSMPNNLSLDCSYDTTTAKVTILGGTAPFSYNWNYLNSKSSELNGVSAGNYILHLTDAAGCDHDTTVVINAPAPVNVNFTNYVDGGEDKVSVTASTSGGTAPYTWSWDPDGQTDSTVTNLSNKKHTVNVLDANGCKFSFQIDVYSEYTGVGYLADKNIYNIYPNPTAGLVNIELNLTTEDDVHVRVLDAIGNVIEVVERNNVLQDNIELNLSSNAAGVYFVETTVGAEKIVSRIQVAH